MKVRSFRNYDMIEAFLSSRKRTLLRRSLTELYNNIRKNPERYARRYDISRETVRTHLAEIRSLFSDLNLE
jgi:DNA-binding CsgD family transcriptional regulator